MRIGLVSTQTGWGGGEKLLAELAKGLARRGVEVALAAPRNSPLAEWAGLSRVGCLPLPGRGRTPAAMWSLRRWATRGGLHAALLNDPHAITYGGVALAGAGVPRIGMRHTVFPVRSAWKHNNLLEAVVAVSHAAQRGCVEAGVLRDRVVVIHGGVDPLPHGPDSIAAARRLFDGSPAAAGPNVLAVGSLLPVKGFDTLVRAAAGASQPWRLWIAGEGPERDALESLAVRLGVADRVRLLGFREDLGPLLAAADAFFSASHSEGLSLVLIEAMLAARPIAATPVGGAREVLGMAEGAGASRFAATFLPGDPNGARRAIEAALDAPAATAAAARQWATERFTLDRMASDFHLLCERLSARRPATVAA